MEYHCFLVVFEHIKEPDKNDSVNTQKGMESELFMRSDYKQPETETRILEET